MENFKNVQDFNSINYIQIVSLITRKILNVTDMLKKILIIFLYYQKFQRSCNDMKKGRISQFHDNRKVAQCFQH